MLSLTQVVYRAIDIYGKADDLYICKKMEEPEKDHTYLVEEADSLVTKIANENGFMLCQVHEEMDKMVPF